MRCPQYEQGRRNGIKACVEYLHARAEEMNDPHARSILNAAAWALGSDLKRAVTTASRSEQSARPNDQVHDEPSSPSLISQKED